MEPQITEQAIIPTEPEIENFSFQPNQIHQTIAILSGKGGVGKTLVTALLAIKLASEGSKVGILDANFSSTPISEFFGLRGLAQRGSHSFLPHQSQGGVKIISIEALFPNEEQNVIWKEALIANLVKELWYEIEWGELDYLLVDLPPANSETTLAIMQTLPFIGSIMVTTPQLVSTKTITRSVKIFQRMGLPIIGIVENMTSLAISSAKDPVRLFGKSHIESLAQLVKLPILAQIPFIPDLCQWCDNGEIEKIDHYLLDDLSETFKEALESVKEQITFGQDQTNNSELINESGGPDKNTNIENPVGVNDSDEEVQSSPFSKTVIHLIRSKENWGTLEKPDGQGYFLGSCGDSMQIDLGIVAGRILDARFTSDGCGVTSACGTMITKMACCKKLEQANQITPDELIEALDGLPDDHLHCAELAVMTLREAIIDAIEGHGNKIKPETA